MAFDSLGFGFGILAGFLGAFLVLYLILFAAIYVYCALAWMSIARKTKTEPAWLAWIPFANLYLMSKIAGMHWWPLLLLVGWFIPFVNIIAAILFFIFVFIWQWKAFEKVGKPGWWVLLALIPIVGAIIYLILLGIAAWGKK